MNANAPVFQPGSDTNQNQIDASVNLISFDASGNPSYQPVPGAVFNTSNIGGAASSSS